MVVILLIFVAATVVTGLVVYGGDQQAGPLAGMFSKETGEAMEGVHELIANITLALVLMHVSAVVLASFVHHENLARAMVHRQEAPVASPTLRGLRDTFAPLNCPRRAQLPRL